MDLFYDRSIEVMKSFDRGWDRRRFLRPLARLCYRNIVARIAR